jgi:hypothetical protein
LGAIPGLRQAEVRDSPWAAGRDFRSATAEPERPLSPEPQNDREPRRAQLPQDALPKAAYRLVLLVSQALRVGWLYPVAPRQALLASQQAQADESVLPQAPAKQASHSGALLLVHESAPWVPQEQPQRAPPVQLASPPQRLELPARSVSTPLAPRSPVVVPRARQASSAQPLQPRPSLLFPLWQPLLLALLLRPLPESSCAPSPRRPRESSSNASSFPLRRTPATGQ